MTSKVYVVQENNHVDYSDAERYGELVFLTAEEFRPIRGSIKNRDIVETIDRRLEGFTQDDFIILTGNPTIIGYAFHKAYDRVNKIGGHLKVLHWDKLQSRYKPTVFEF